MVALICSSLDVLLAGCYFKDSVFWKGNPMLFNGEMNDWPLKVNYKVGICFWPVTWENAWLIIIPGLVIWLWAHGFCFSLDVFLIKSSCPVAIWKIRSFECFFLLIVLFVDYYVVDWHESRMICWWYKLTN